MKKPWYKKWWIWAIAVIIFFIAAFGGDDEKDVAQNNPADNGVEQGDQTTDDNEDAAGDGEQQEDADDQGEPQEQENEEEPDELTPQQEMFDKITGLIKSGKAFDTGSYIKGDIPAGEYAFVTFEGSGKYYVEKDSSGKIVDNENFDSFGYVQVHGVGNLQTKGALIHVDSFNELGVSGAKEIYEILNNNEGYKESGYYKIGKDLPAGEYVLESYGKGYVAVMTGPVGKSDIVDNENFEGRYSVNVKDGQYLKVSRAVVEPR